MDERGAGHVVLERRNGVIVHRTRELSAVLGEA
jgi:hypothetical protein